jgi:hypothetical protein
VLVRVGTHLRRNLVAYLALFLALGGTSYAATRITGAQIADGSITGADLRNGSITARDVRRGSLLASSFATGQLRRAVVAANGAPGSQGSQGPRGLTGPPGAPGPAGAAAPSFGDGTQVGNRENVACGVENVVGRQTITLTQPSRILAFGNGAMRDDGAATTTYGLWLRLRDASDTTTLAVTTAAWDFDGAAQASDTVMPLSLTSVMLAGGFPEDAGSAYIAQPGTYRLELIAFANEGTCTTALPDFGVNQGGGMGYVILGTG